MVLTEVFRNESPFKDLFAPFEMHTRTLAQRGKVSGDYLTLGIRVPGDLPLWVGHYNGKNSNIEQEDFAIASCGTGEIFNPAGEESDESLILYKGFDLLKNGQFKKRVTVYPFNAIWVVDSSIEKDDEGYSQPNIEELDEIKELIGRMDYVINNVSF